jgi:hypothetical protein
VPPPQGRGVPDSGGRDNRHCNDPLAGHLRAAAQRRPPQSANADPVDRLICQPRRRSLRIQRGALRLCETVQFGSGTVRDGDKNGQCTGCKERQISHIRASMQTG